MDIKNIMRKTIDITQTAGKIILENWDRDRQVHKKGRIDLVTDTDYAVEKFLKRELGGLLPAAGFMAEESTQSKNLEPGMTWIIDPLDGTTNFAHYIPMLAVSVALWSDGEPLLGIVHLPLFRETFSALKGQGALLNNKPIQATETKNMQDALVATGFPYTIREDVDEVLKILRRVLVSARGVRRPGSAAFDLAYTACGRYDAFYETGLKPWDTAAGMLLVREAGGKITRFDGSDYTPGDPDILASNTHLHCKLLALTKPGS